MNESTETPEFDRLADQVIRRERVLLFAPGIASFLTALMTTMFGLIVLFVAAVSLLLVGASEETQAFTSLGSVQIAIVLVLVPSLLLMKGSPVAAKIWRRVVDLGLIGALGFTGWTWIHPFSSMAVQFGLSAALLGVAFIVLRTVGFAMITIFRQRMKVRRDVYLAETTATRRS